MFWRHTHYSYAQVCMYMYMYMWTAVGTRTFVKFSSMVQNMTLLMKRLLMADDYFAQLHVHVYVYVQLHLYVHFEC